MITSMSMSASAKGHHPFFFAGCFFAGDSVAWGEAVGLAL